MPNTPTQVRVAAVGDLHFTRGSPSLRPLIEHVAAEADVLALCGDLTDTGLPEEAALLAKEFASLKVPIVAVLGNHDYESGHVPELKRIFCDAGIWILDGDAHEVDGVGFAGVKGFAGGFGRGTLGPWGEEMIKRFVHEALDEALKLESALRRLHSPNRIALLHYSPIAGTIEGEPPEIYPWLGSSRLEEPLSRYPVNAVFHGHAHHGQPEGRTLSGVQVFNVSHSLLQRLYPDRPPVRILTLDKPAPSET
jgi:Icc-related predicted phosphoesterase